MSHDDDEINGGMHEFTVTDRRGKVHSYSCTEHAGGEGMAIMFTVLSLGAPTVLSLIGASMASEKMASVIMAAFSDGESSALELADVAELGSIVAEIDLGMLGAEISKTFGSGVMPKLCRDVLKHTVRDGKRVPDVFEICYQANYIEMMQAAWKVAQINGFFPVPTTSPGSSDGKKKTASP